MNNPIRATSRSSELNSDDAAHLRAAIAASRVASARGDEPYGAVLVDATGHIRFTAGNTQVTERDCTGHAEANLLREATRQLDPKTLAQCTIYASGEPCAMCAGAIYWSNVRRVVYALPVALMSELSPGTDELLWSCRDVLARGMRTVEVVGPALEDEASAVLVAHQARRNPG